MATKKNIKVKDLKPNKDAKGGGGSRQMQGGTRNRNQAGRNTDGSTRMQGGTRQQGAGRNLN